MKNKILKLKIISLFFILKIFANGVTLDNLIDEYEKNSYTNKINEISLKTYDIKEKAIEKGDWNNIKFTSNSTFQRQKKYDGSIENEVTYGLLYYKNQYNFSDNKLEENKIGVSKTLNNFFYSDKKYNSKINNLSKEIQKIDSETDKNTEIRNLIDLYKEYKNKEKEIEQGGISLENKKNEYNIISEKYKLGTASRYDYNLSKTEYDNTKLKNENYERELKILKEKFMIYNINLDNIKELSEISERKLEKEDFYKIRISEANKIKVNEEINDEKLKKEKFDYDIPKVVFDSGYSFKNQSLTVGVGVTKNIKIYNDDLESLENEKKKLKLEYEKKKNEILSNVGQEMLNYMTYQTNEEINKNTMDLAKENYEIYKKRYDLGMDTYSNYVEKRNEYEKSIIDYEISKNELAAYTIKIKYYK